MERWTRRTSQEAELARFLILGLWGEEASTPRSGCLLACWSFAVGAVWGERRALDLEKANGVHAHSGVVLSFCPKDPTNSHKDGHALDPFEPQFAQTIKSRKGGNSLKVLSQLNALSFMAIGHKSWRAIPLLSMIYLLSLFLRERDRV